jgi:putative ABC transport system substrate-binding protein
MGTSLEAVEVGLVDSLARPDGNVTGLSLISADLMEKRLALLKKAFPHLSHLAFLTGPLGQLDQDPLVRRELALMVKVAEEAAKSLRLRLHIISCSGSNCTSYEASRQAVPRSPPGVVLSLPGRCEVLLCISPIAALSGGITPISLCAMD